jgi:hypothetical protein
MEGQGQGMLDVATAASGTLTGVPATMSKLRYAELERTLRASAIDGDAVTQMLRALCDVLRFDPTASGYTPRRAASIRAWRAKKKKAAGSSA